MANTETLERIAKLLPQQEREQFFAMIARFKSVPDDDEYLQIINAVGLMTLLWKEVPNEIRKVLEGANPISDTCHSVARQVREAVTDAIPSCEDLVLVSKRLEEHELALKRLLASNKKTQPGSSNVIGRFLFTVSGTLLGLFLYQYLAPMLSL